VHPQCLRSQYAISFLRAQPLNPNPPAMSTDLPRSEKRMDRAILRIAAL